MLVSGKLVEKGTKEKLNMENTIKEISRNAIIPLQNVSKYCTKKTK